MKRTILTPAQADWLTATMARNRALFGGWSMEDAPNDDGDSDSDSDESDDGDEEDDSEDDSEDDWKAKFEAQQRINRNLEKRTRKDQARIKELEAKSTPKGDGEPDADKIREEAKAEAAREALNGRVEDKIEAKASAFADPEDVVAILLKGRDIEDFIDDGKVDVDAIVDALKELGEKKPHLLAKGGKRFQGDADQGARKGSKARPKSLGDAVSRHYQPRK
jgi:hypothetical protein